MIRGNRGQVLMLVAVMLVALVWFAALGIDTAYMFSVRHELQRCADSAALAGASWYIDNSVPAPTDMPEDRAREYAKRDIVATAPLTDSEVQVTASPLPPVALDNQVRVVTRRTVNLFFRIWQPSLPISASAIAEGRIFPDPPNPDRRIVRLVQ